MRVDEFDYHLPEELIALRPASPRDAARLLVVDPGRRAFGRPAMLDLPGLLRPGDALVFNDTKVIPAELRGVRDAGRGAAQISVNLIERLGAGALAGFGAPGEAAQAGRPHHFRRGRQCLPARRACRDASRRAARRAT